MEIYERSRHRNHSHNISASSSLAGAHRSLGDRGMASTHGVSNQESKINSGYQIALLIALGSPTTVDRWQPPAMANRVQRLLDGTNAHTELHSVTGGRQSKISAESSALATDWTLDIEYWMFARQRGAGL